MLLIKAYCKDFASLIRELNSEEDYCEREKLSSSPNYLQGRKRIRVHQHSRVFLKRGVIYRPNCRRVSRELIFFGVFLAFGPLGFFRGNRVRLDLRLFGSTL